MQKQLSGCTDEQRKSKPFSLIADWTNLNPYAKRVIMCHAKNLVPNKVRSSLHTWYSGKMKNKSTAAMAYGRRTAANSA